MLLTIDLNLGQGGRRSNLRPENIQKTLLKKSSLYSRITQVVSGIAGLLNKRGWRFENSVLVQIHAVPR